MNILNKFIKELIYPENSKDISFIIDNQDLLADCECTICSMLVSNPLYCSECESMCCRSCLEDWWEISQNYLCCPFKCKSNSIKEPPRIIQKLIQSTNLKCQNSTKGCSEILSYNDFDNHLKECSYREVKCKGCNNIFCLTDIYNHIPFCSQNFEEFVYSGKKIFGFPLIECSFCKKFFELNEIEDHLNNCGEIVIKCSFCEEEYKKMEYLEHSKEQCMTVLKDKYLEQMEYIETLKKEIKSIKRLRKKRMKKGMSDNSTAAEYNNNDAFSFTSSDYEKLEFLDLSRELNVIKEKPVMKRKVLYNKHINKKRNRGNVQLFNIY